MKAVKILVIILFALIIGSLAWAFFLPANIHIEEKTTINAPMEKVFSQVNNFRNWKNWSMWQDSTLLTKYQGPQQGLGSKMLWTDEKEGRSVQTIIESIENEKVVTELAFNDQKNEAQSVFTFLQTDTGVVVSWSMDVNDLSYPFGRFVGYMIRKGATYNFAKGLNNMKTFVEANKSIPDFAGFDIKDEQLQTKYFVSYVDSGLHNELEGKIAAGYGQIMAKLAEMQITSKGYPCVEWNSFDPMGTSSLRCMIPVGNINSIEGEVHSYQKPAGRYVWLKYVGAYDQSAIAWESLDKYVQYYQLQMNGSPFEEYITDPGSEPDTTKWITNIYFPVAPLVAE